MIILFLFVFDKLSGGKMFDNKDAQFITILLLTCLICFLFSSKVFSASYDQFFGTTSSFTGPTAGGSFGFAPGGFGFGGPSFSFGPSMNMGFNFGAPTGFGTTNYSYGMPQTMGFGFASPALSFGLPTMGFGFGAPNLYGTPMGISYNPFAFPQSQQSSTSQKPSQTTEADYPGVYLDPLEEEIPNVKGYWSGHWESFATSSDGEVQVDANHQIIIDQSGDLKFHFTKQNTKTGVVEGTLEILDWNVSEYPNWEGESEEVKISGYVDEYNKWFFASYFNFEGSELLDDYSNLITHYSWTFNNVTIMDNWFYGQFMVKGTNDYEIVGKFTVTDYVP